MRITFILPSPGLAGGIRVVAIYADKLRQRGHYVLTVYPKSRKYSFKRKMFALLSGRGWPKVKQVESHLDILNVPQKKLDHYAPITNDDVPDADVVIATYWPTVFDVAEFSDVKGAKAYFLQHFVDTNVRKEIAEGTRRACQNNFYKITICQWLVDILRDRFDETEVALVPNSVDTNQFSAPARNKNSTPTFGVMYSGANFKGCDITFRAFEIAKKISPQLKFVAFGHKINDARLPLPDFVAFHQAPPQNKIPEIYASCDAWLFGSRTEGFGLPILEAMACRTPVIGTPTGAAPELISKYGAGILVNHEDPEDMAKAIIKVSEMADNEWKKMSDAAYKTATEYTWDDATDLFEAALFRAIEKTKDNSNI